MFVDTWIRGFQIIYNILLNSKVNKYFDGILNLRIVLCKKYTKLNVQRIKMILQYSVSGCVLRSWYCTLLRDLVHSYSLYPSYCINKPMLINIDLLFMLRGLPLWMEPYALQEQASSWLWLRRNEATWKPAQTSSAWSPLLPRHHEGVPR